MEVRLGTNDGPASRMLDNAIADNNGSAFDSTIGREAVPRLLPSAETIMSVTINDNAATHRGILGRAKDLARRISILWSSKFLTPRASRTLIGVGLAAFGVFVMLIVRLRGASLGRKRPKALEDKSSYDFPFRPPLEVELVRPFVSKRITCEPADRLGLQAEYNSQELNGVPTMFVPERFRERRDNEKSSGAQSGEQNASIWTELAPAKFEAIPEPRGYRTVVEYLDEFEKALSDVLNHTRNSR